MFRQSSDQEMKQPLLAVPSPAANTNPAIDILSHIVQSFEGNPNKSISTEDNPDIQIAGLFKSFWEALNNPPKLNPTQQNEVRVFLKKHLYKLPPLEEAQTYIDTLRGPSIQNMQLLSSSSAATPSSSSSDNASAAPSSSASIAAALQADDPHHQLAVRLAAGLQAHPQNCLVTAFKSCAQSVKKCRCIPCSCCRNACSTCCSCKEPDLISINQVRGQASWFSRLGNKFVDPDWWCGGPSTLGKALSCQCCGSLKHKLCNIPNPFVAGAAGTVTIGGGGPLVYNYHFVQSASAAIDTANTSLSTFAARSDVIQMLVILRDYGYEFLSPVQQALYAQYNTLTGSVSSATAKLATLNVGGSAMIGFTTIAGILLLCGGILCCLHYQGNRITNFSIVWNVCYQMFTAVYDAPALRQALQAQSPADLNQ